MLKFLLALLIVMPSLSIASEDEGLYPDAPPVNAAFVRVINQSGAVMNDASLSGISLGDVDAMTVTEYAVLTEGESEIKLGDKTLNHTLVAGDYYTVASKGDTLIILGDQKVENPTKALIAVYNLSDIENISFVSTTHNADIFKDVVSGTSNARDINAVSIGVGIKNDDVVVAEISDVKLERQVATSIFIVGENDNYDVIIKNNKALK